MSDEFKAKVPPTLQYHSVLTAIGRIFQEPTTNVELTPRRNGKISTHSHNVMKIVNAIRKNSRLIEHFPNNL